MTTSDRLELAAQCLEQAETVREWIKTANIDPDTRPEVEQRAITAHIQAQWVFQVLLTRMMRKS